jgi:hypothetical protein
MDQPTGGAEPNIAVLADGTLFIAAVSGSQERPNALAGAAWLWRSADGGTSWETLRAPQRGTALGTLPGTRRPFGSSDADVVTSPDGWVYYTDWWNWGAPLVAPDPAGLGVNARHGNYLVERSGDGGKTWEASPVTTLDGLTGAVDRQWLLAGEDGFVGLFYAYFHPVQNQVRALGDPLGRSDFLMSLQVVLSDDHGASWSDPVTVVGPVSGRGYQIAHPTILAGGALAMPLGDTDESNLAGDWRAPSRVRVMVSEDHGLSWWPRDVAQVPEGFDNLWAVQGAADGEGNLFVAWAARTGENMTVFVRGSGDEGLTWGEPEPLRSAGLNFLPWVAARGAGQVAVGWYGSDASGDPEKAGNDTAWFSYVAERSGPGQPWRVGKVSDEPVKTGPMCPKGAACRANRELLDYVSLAYDGDGRLHHAFATSREVGGAKAGLVHYAARAG